MRNIDNYEVSCVTLMIMKLYYPFNPSIESRKIYFYGKTLQFYPFLVDNDNHSQLAK